MVPELPKGKHAEFQEFLRARGFSFENRPHQVFLARGNGLVVNLYESGKIVIGGASQDERGVVETRIAQLAGNAEETAPPIAPDLPDFSVTHVGMDEVGKGDYFGPLIACAVLVSPYQIEKLAHAGVRDSKSLSPQAITEISQRIRRDVLVRGQWRVVRIPPERYNVLHVKMQNLNKMLGWAHARALEDVLQFKEPCELAIADQFGDPRYIEERLFARGRRIRLVQMPRAERDLAVAAASIIARSEFVEAMDAMSKKYGVKFPLGASHVEEFGRQLVGKFGPTVLIETAKVHFATTQRILPSLDLVETALRARAAHEP